MLSLTASSLRPAVERKILGGGDFCEKLDRSSEEAREKVAMGARRPCGCALRCKSEETVCGQTRWATGDVAN